MKIGRVLWHPVWIAVAFGIAWGPIFIADIVRIASPALNAAYLPQWFAMRWLPITVLASLVGVLLLVLHAIRLGLSLLKRSKSQSNGR